jgi:hypothetical protein
MVRFASYNMLDLYLKDTPDELERRERVYQVIREINPDVLAAEEIIADGDDKAVLAAKRVAELAEATGLQCEYVPGKVAVAVGNHRFNVALLWRPGIEYAGGWGEYAGTNMWHCEARLHLDVGGTVVQHAAFHATPFGRFRRADEFERVHSTMTRPENRPPGLIGADWNAVSADRRTDGQYYDPDPYANKPWHPDFVYQCDWDYDEHGIRRHWADRRPGEVLVAGGLQDAAAVLDSPWQTTVGHWPVGDPYGERRIDAIKVTRELAPALRGYQVFNTPLAVSASDHLPIAVDYDPAEIA